MKDKNETRGGASPKRWPLTRLVPLRPTGPGSLTGLGRVAPGGAAARRAEWALGECAQPAGLRFTKARVAKPVAQRLPPATGPVRLACAFP
jgi:hypothetical protein